MLSLGRILGVLAIHRSLSDTSHFQKFLARAGNFILLTVVSAFMVGAVMVGALFMLHHTLISYGLTTDVANLSVAAFALLMTLVLVLAVNLQLQKLQESLHEVLRRQSPIPSKITETAEAFIHGLTTPARSSSRRTYQ